MPENASPPVCGDIRDYLDAAITKWRVIRDAEGEHADIAPFYIDAYQSARVSLVGELLP